MQQHVLFSNEPKTALVTPLLISLHWLPVVARIKFKTLVLSYRTPTPLHPYLSYASIPPRESCVSNEQSLVVPSQRGTKSLLKMFPHWWNDLPNTIRTAESLTSFKKQLKTHLIHASKKNDKLKTCITGDPSV